jgi:hypothetical protein
MHGHQTRRRTSLTKTWRERWRGEIRLRESKRQQNKTILLDRSSRRAAWWDKTRMSDGAESMVYEIKWPASWKTSREGFDEYSSKFSLS